MVENSRAAALYDTYVSGTRGSTDCVRTRKTERASTPFTTAIHHRHSPPPFTTAISIIDSYIHGCKPLLKAGQLLLKPPRSQDMRLVTRHLEPFQPYASDLYSGEAVRCTLELVIYTTDSLLMNTLMLQLSCGPTVILTPPG